MSNVGNLSHVKWFTPEETPFIQGLNAQEWALVIVMVISGLGLLWSINRFMQTSGKTKKLDRKFKPLRPWVPLVVRLSTASLLFINAINGYLLAPNVPIEKTVSTQIATLIFILAGTLILFGVMTRVGAALLVAGWLAVLVSNDVANVVDHFEYLGIAGYLLLRGPGKYSLDATAGKLKSQFLKYNDFSLPVYRIGIGISLVALALSEKLLGISLATEFLNSYSWNFLSGFEVADRAFIIIAGTIELIVGLSLIFNLASRLVVMIVLGLMIITASLLGLNEIYGHLFAIGIVFAVLVNDVNPSKTS